MEWEVDDFYFNVGCGSFVSSKESRPPTTDATLKYASEADPATYLHTLKAQNNPRSFKKRPMKFTRKSVYVQICIRWNLFDVVGFGVLVPRCDRLLLFALKQVFMCLIGSKACKKIYKYIVYRI